MAPTCRDLKRAFREGTTFAQCVGENHWEDRSILEFLALKFEPELEIEMHLG